MSGYSNRITCLLVLVPLCTAFSVKDEAARLADFEVTARRVFTDWAEGLRQPNNRFSDEQLRQSSLQDLTQILNANPSLSAYRRTSSKSAHPTTQGIRYRNLGINATSRTLVLLDGIPQNDPFGAWVHWNKFQIDSLASAQSSQTPQNELWGNFGSGGLISLNSFSGHSGRQSLSASYGTDDSYSLSVGNNRILDNQSSIDLDFRIFDSGGFYTIPSSQRGPLDVKASSKSKAGRIGYNWRGSHDWYIQANIEYFEEDRVNGTPLAANATKALDTSLQATRSLDRGTLQISSYHQDRDFRNQFTSVDVTRATERPALEQFDVPARSTGLSFAYATDQDSARSLLLGLDARIVEGEVNERYRNLGNGFTRQREAGGQQVFLGAFASTQLKLSEKRTLSLSTRLDSIEQTDGHRSEFNTETNTQILNASYDNQSDWLPSFNIDLAHQIDDKQQVRIAISQGFRAPTLNELYRPFRVRNDITEANPDLTNETIRGIQASYRWQDDDKLDVSINAFHYQLDDAVANMLLATDPGFNATYGVFIPTGGSYSQRRNIPRSNVSGFELETNAQISESVAVVFNYTYAPTKIRSNAAYPSLAGTAFPQSPESKAFARINWNLSPSTRLWASANYWDQQFEDLAGLRRIDSAINVDLGFNYALSDSTSLQAKIENALDATIESGLSTSGLITRSAPRSAWLTLSYHK